MSFLRHHVSERGRLTLSSGLLLPFSFLGIETRREGCTHSVEMNDDGPICFHHGSLTPQRYHFAEDTHGFVGKGIEILGVDTRSSIGGHFGAGGRDG